MTACNLLAWKGLSVFERTSASHLRVVPGGTVDRITRIGVRPEDCSISFTTRGMVDHTYCLFVLRLGGVGWGTTEQQHAGGGAGRGEEKRREREQGEKQMSKKIGQTTELQMYGIIMCSMKR